MNKEQLILSGKICPYCGRETELIDSAEVYHGTSYGWMYMCRPCNAYVGCYAGTTNSFGRLANAELRSLKSQAHDVFDQIWKSGLMSRTEAYEWLSEQLNTPKELTHIGMFNEETCKKVVRICNEYLKSKEHVENNCQLINVQLINNHIVLDDGQGLILDTGSPLSFHTSGVINICGRRISVPTSLPMVPNDYLHNNVYRGAEGLLGMDIINKYPITISLNNSFIIVGDDAHFQELPTVNVNPLVGIQLVINGSSARMIVDTGAKLSYISHHFTAGLQPIGSERDFSPYMGEFNTEVFNCETLLANLYIGDVSYTQKYGTPPPLLAMMLKQMNVDGVIGVDLFKQFRLQLKERKVYFPPQGI